MASPVVWIRQLSGAFVVLILFHSDSDPRYRCYSVVAEKICECCTSSAFADLRASLTTGVYMCTVHGGCVSIKFCVSPHTSSKYYLHLGAGVNAVGSRDGYLDAVNPFYAPCSHHLLRCGEPKSPLKWDHFPSPPIVWGFQGGGVSNWAVQYPFFPRFLLSLSLSSPGETRMTSFGSEQVQVCVCVRISVFHMRCVRSILGITCHRCWDDHISNNQLLEWWGDSETIVTKVQHRRLEWLGHVARMDDVRLAKQLLFGTLPSRRPAHGPHRRWKDCAVKDLRSRDLEADWYRVACDSRPDWRLAYTSDAPLPAGEERGPMGAHRPRNECNVYLVWLLCSAAQRTVLGETHSTHIECPV